MQAMVPADAGSGNKVACDAAGPQAPRDIRNSSGTNATSFDAAPAASAMHLCDIHFHRNAEHRAAGYSRLAGNGNNAGYICNGSTPAKHATGAGHADHADHGCSGIAAGDTIEVHWVYTSCDVQPGPALTSCFTDTCKHPKLRVEARVFHLTDNASDAKFGDFSDYSSGSVVLPPATDPVHYAGSTTGPSYNDATCSPFHVTWNVSSACQNLNLETINKWCGKSHNDFQEDHAHGVRALVTDPALLSTIK